MDWDGKRCPHCGEPLSLDALVHSPEVEAVGMSLAKEDPARSCYYFTHVHPHCRRTFTVPIQAFAAFLNESLPEYYSTNQEDCGLHCMDIENHSDCEAQCFNAPYRRFMREVLLGHRSRVGMILPS